MSLLYAFFGKIRTIDDFAREAKKRKIKKADIIIQTTTQPSDKEDLIYRKEVFVTDPGCKINLKLGDYSCCYNPQKGDYDITCLNHRAYEDALIYGSCLSGLHNIDININGSSLEETKKKKEDLEAAMASMEKDS